MTKSNEDKSSWLQLGDPMDLESAGGYRRTSGGGPKWHHKQNGCRKFNASPKLYILLTGN